eukprot:9339234-Lingulodinium_polyedra.AAC.1
MSASPSCEGGATEQVLYQHNGVEEICLLGPAPFDASKRLREGPFLHPSSQLALTKGSPAPVNGWQDEQQSAA